MPEASASESRALKFGQFTLMGRYGPLINGNRTLKLQPKAMSVLWTLIRQAGQVVTKNDLVDAVWPDEPVTDEALTFQIQSLRQTLGDKARHPSYIETIHRVGFRFIASLDGATPAQEPGPASIFVSREQELEALNSAFNEVLNGTRQTLFITGEAGIGKTSLLENFRHQLFATHPGLSVGWGQCVETRGTSEAYLPILEALGDLLKNQASGEHFDSLLRAAPIWLSQLPSLLTPEDHSDLLKRVAGVSRERMLRELAEALEIMSQDNPLVLVFEDLHWSDASTLDLLRMLARRREGAKLLIICSYRPVDAIVNEHEIRNLKLALTGSGHAQEIVLDFLTQYSVSEYLIRRLPNKQPAEEVCTAIYNRSQGLPIFMTAIVDYLINSGADFDEAATLVEQALPQNLNDFITLQIEQLESDDQEILLAGSIVGSEFPTCIIAELTGMTVASIEARCSRLSQQKRFIEDAGLEIWPDGTISGRFSFSHALYEDAFYRRSSTSQAAERHQRIAQMYEQGYGRRAAEIANPLANHFNAAGQAGKALEYTILAGQEALAGNAIKEAEALVARGFELLPQIQETDRIDSEVALLMIGVHAASSRGGYANPELPEKFDRIQALLPEVRAPELKREAISQLWISSFFQSRHELARELAQQTLALAEQQKSAYIKCTGLVCTALAEHISGNPAAAAELSAQAVDIANSTSDDDWVYSTSETGCAALTCQALSCWKLGSPDTALELAHQAAARAESLGNPYMECATHSMTMPSILCYRRDYASLLEECRKTIALCQHYGYVEGIAWATKFQGIALVMQGQTREGLEMLRLILSAQKMAGATLTLVIDHGNEAECCLHAGLIDEAKEALDAAFTLLEETGERVWETELWRLKGEYTLKAGRPDMGEAEKCFKRSLELARHQKAKSFELRTSVSLARLWQTQKKNSQAKRLLNPVYQSFNEGFETADLIEAADLLDSLNT